jgi:murein DD-endopeptidase MepM/ murein hydrolase activator NlpD
MFGVPQLTPVRVVVLAVALCAVILLLTSTGERSVVSRWGMSTGQAAGTSPLVGRGMPSPDDDKPWGNPLRSERTVMTQGYGVGTHAPVNIWGAVDLALGPNGRATPEATWDAPIYATHSGTVKLAPNSWPAGNHVWVISSRYKTGYAHLQNFAPGLKDGDQVTRGQLIGYVGSTGMSSGPHLHYHIWEDGQNVNPLDFGVLEGVPGQ